jgi:hypothetical protein
VYALHQRRLTWADKPDARPLLFKSPGAERRPQPSSKGTCPPIPAVAAAAAPGRHHVAGLGVGRSLESRPGTPKIPNYLLRLKGCCTAPRAWGPGGPLSVTILPPASSPFGSIRNHIWILRHRLTAGRADAMLGILLIAVKEAPHPNYSFQVVDISLVPQPHGPLE